MVARSQPPASPGLEDALKPREWKPVAAKVQPLQQGQTVTTALGERRRAELQNRAFELGREIYANSPADFGREVRRQWKTWRAGNPCLTG